MKKALYLLLVVATLSTACKSEFEKVRTSGDPKLLHEKAVSYFEQADYQKSQTLLELIIPSYRGKKELEDIYHKYSYTYYHMGNYVLAAYYFKNFSKTFPNSQQREEVDFMSAYSNYQLSPTYRLDQDYSSKAIDELQIFANTYPESERVTEANTLIEELRLKLEKKAFHSAELYYDLRQYQSAVQLLENLLKDFPDTRDAEEVRYLIVKSTYELAGNSIIDRQKERYELTNKRAEKFLSRYDNSQYANEVTSINKRSIQKLKNISTDDRYKIKGAVIGS